MSRQQNENGVKERERKEERKKAARSVSVGVEPEEKEKRPRIGVQDGKQQQQHSTRMLMYATRETVVTRLVYNGGATAL